MSKLAHCEYFLSDVLSVIVELFPDGTISSSGEGYGFRKFPYPSNLLDANKCSVYNWSMIYSEGKLMEEQKETYKEMLHKIIDSIDNADYLLYLIIFIQEKFKAG